MTDEKRPLRICDSCGQIDDHPRHVLATLEDTGKSHQDVLDLATENADSPEKLKAVIAAAQDSTVLTKHMDCCAADGCPVCTDVLSKTKDAHGLALAKALSPKEEN